MNVELFVALCVAHLLGDFVFANHIMAINKHNPRTIYFYLHGLIHFFFYWLFSQSLELALILALIHMLIDTRIFVDAWQRAIKQTTSGEIGIIVKMALDQTLHIISIFIILKYVYGVIL